jgi:MFS family permease
MQKPTRESVLNPTVLRLGFVSLLADISGDMLYPITPVFLTTALGASMASIGLVEGCAEATASLLKLFSGAWSDRTGARKIFFVWGYAVAAISKPLIGLSHFWPEVLFARSLDRLGKGLRASPRDALLSDTVSEASRGRVFGWHRAMDSTGAALGPLLAIAYLKAYANNLRPIFFIALVPGVLATALALTVREQRAAPRPRRALLPKWGETPSAFRRYLAVWGLFSLANSSDVFLLLRASRAGFDLVGTVLLYCVYNCLYAVLSPYLGGLSDRFGRRTVLAGGLLAFAAVYAGFAFADARWEFWALFAVYGVYMAATDGAGKALAVDLMPRDRKATALGAFGMVSGLCALFASFVAGALWDKLGTPAPFLYGAGGALAALALLSTVRK